MSESLSRRGVLQLGSCVSFAAGVLSISSPAIAGRSEVAALWDAYCATRNENDRRFEIWSEVCKHASARSPELPEGLAFPNPQFCPWLQIDREGTIWAVRKREPGSRSGLYYRPEILADFLADPPEICSSLDSERVPRILALIRELLPAAEAYRAAVKEAWREADEIEAACDFEALFEQQMAAADALMDATPASASDFVFKARLIRQRLDDELSIEDESRKLTDQMVSFWGAGVNV